MLEGLIGDIGFAMGSQVSDSLSTLFASRNKDAFERNVDLRESIDENGIVSTVLKDGIENIIKFGIYGLALYGADNLIGIEDNNINLHHSLLYGMGAIKYYVSVCNVAVGLGFKRLSNILNFPLNMTLGKISSYKRPDGM